jgi:hypothetical protein
MSWYFLAEYPFNPFQTRTSIVAVICRRELAVREQKILQMVAILGILNLKNLYRQRIFKKIKFENLNNVELVDNKLCAG